MVGRFYVSGGIDDRIAVYAKHGEIFFEFDAPAIILGHNSDGTRLCPKYDGGILARR